MNAPEIVMHLSTGPASAPRVPCQRCGATVAVEMILHADQRNVCIACCSAEMEDALRRGVAIPVVAAKARVIEAWRAFEADVVGLPS